jgi:hypothetical protein
VIGTQDPLAGLGRGYAFEKAPENPLNRYADVDAGHLEVPSAAKDIVLEWLAKLP